MRKLQLTLMLLFFELCTLHGHVIPKREGTDVDRYAVKSDKDTIELINPKARKPTLREIIFYHVIEKPYPNIKQKSIINNDDETMINDNNLKLKDDNKVTTNDFQRPWTNGHGFQYLEGNNLTDQDEADNAEPSESQRSVENDIPTLPDDKKDELLDDEPQNVINDDTFAPENAKNDQENDKDSKDVESDLTEEVNNNNDPKKENERPIHIEGPAEDNITGTDGIAEEDLRDDEEPPKVNPSNKNGIGDLRKIEDDKTIRFRDFITEGEGPRGARRKRDIDYSKMHDAPPLPLFKMDVFPDYIKEILPSDNDLEIKTEQSAFLSRTTKKPAYLSRTTKKPAFLSRSTEKPAYLSRTTEESLYLTERPEVAKKPVYLSKTTEKPVYMSRSTEKSENSMPKISVRIGDSDEQKLKRKSAWQFDEEVEQELSEAIRKVAEAQDKNTKAENPSSGMNLIGNTGVVWNDLHGQHFKYNVGPDATDTEDHNAQIPVKPSKDKPEGTTEKDADPIDLSSEIESALEEIGHIFEEILDQTDNQEDTESDKVTTENYDIHVNINKDHDKHDNFEENPKESNDLENKESKDENQSSDEQTTTEPVENLDDRVMDFIQAVKDIIENSKKNESENQENGVKDEVIEPHKDSNKDDSKSNDEIEDDPDTRKNKKSKKAIRELLNNEKYWEWLKDTSESHMNIILKRVLGLIKQEVSKQIQQLVTRMMEEQGDAPSDDHDDKQLDKHDSDTTERHKNEKENGEDDPKPHLPQSIDKYWDWLKDSSEAYFNILFKRLLRKIAEGVADEIDIFATRMFKEKGYTVPKKDENINAKRDEHDDEEDTKVIQILKRNDKWRWLTKSSEAYLHKIMKRVNRLIEEEVNRQITHLVKFHMPNKNDEETSTEEHHDKKQESNTKNDNNLDANKDSDSESDEKLSKKTIQLDESKDQVNDKKYKEGKDKKKQKHQHENNDERRANNVKISAENSYGTSLNNEKVTNIYIFGLNRKDFNKIKPISSGNGIYVFGTQNDNKKLNIDSDKQPTEITERNKVTDDPNNDPIPNEDKVEITTPTSVKDEEELESTDFDSNKDENDKDSSKETEKENPQKPDENSEKSEENPKASSGENQTEDSKKSGEDNENTDKDSKDTQNTDEDLRDEDKVEIDERLGEILVGQPKDKDLKDSSENAKDKETNEATTETSIDKSTDEDKVEKDEPKDKETKDSSENVKDKETNESTTETTIDKSSE